MKAKTAGFYWHVHHDVLLEYCYDYQERVEYIKKYKPKHEVETRLRLFQPVRGKLPKEVIEAGQKWNEAVQKYDEAWRKYCEAWQKCSEARRKHNEALRKHKSHIEQLHQEECGCTEWNGKELVFTDKEVSDE